jgi:dTDP-4-amino-4,6-dideoxygalactose transaminase
MYYLLLEDLDHRRRFIEELAARGIISVFHYIPLHASPAGRTYGRTAGELRITEDVSERLVRLPLWVDLEQREIAEVISQVTALCR